MNVLIWREMTEAERDRALERPVAALREELARGVAGIIREVREGGDAALRALTARFDGVETELAVTEAERTRARTLVTTESREALIRAAAQIERFHAECRPREVTLEISPGLVCSRKPIAMEKVGLYIPGGTAPLPSTILMLGVPARLAGCPMRVLCSPPRRDGSLDPHILVAADICGIEKIYKVGGAQAIAAMAYGTVTVPKVHKIFGPGNSWVTEAKAQAAADPMGAACDMPAGPSEVMVVADPDARPVFVAADLLSQAEHGRDSQVVLVSPSREVLWRAQTEVTRQLATLSRKDIATAALEHARYLLVGDLDEAMDVANRYAPEHLILQTKDARALAEKVRHAGSVFLGAWSPESVGDYASGTNHVLPTYGFARAYSGVSVDSFVKQVTFQELSPDALRDIGPTVERLAKLEGLDAHARAVTLRLKALEEGATC